MFRRIIFLVNVLAMFVSAGYAVAFAFAGDIPRATIYLVMLVTFIAIRILDEVTA